MQPVFHSAEIIGNVPILRRTTRGGFAALYFAVNGTTAVASYIGADCATGNRAADGGDVLAASAADLVAEHAANDRADDRAAHVQIAAGFTDGIGRRTAER